MTTPLRYGMVGGGAGAFIGAVHRMAIALDGKATLAAGALSSEPARAVESALALGLPRDRCYPTWRAMLEGELARPADDRIGFVSIVTPNSTHHEIARAFAAAGFHAVVDKPVTTTAADATDLVETARAHGVVLAVTYNYTGYPMVREAASLVRSGAIGAVRRVVAHYHQGWLAGPLERTGQKQASWRTDPAQAGAGALGDIGSHAENLVSFVTGLEIDALCADVRSAVDGRRVDDDASVLVRYRGGARGVYSISQVCPGEENNLELAVWGERGGLRWRQEEPNTLLLTDEAGARRVITRGSGGLSAAASGATRLPPGHPEGFIEAFASVYAGAIAAMRWSDANKNRPGGRAVEAGRAREPAVPAFPTGEDGLRGVRFIETALASARAGGAWTTFGP